MEAINQDNIWCTLVMLNDNYACGAATMAESLRKVKTKYPIWCMVAGDVSPDCKLALNSTFDRVVEVPLISYPVKEFKSKLQRNIYGSWITSSFTKWQIFNPEYFPPETVNKVILLDADMIFVENCDELFELPAPAMTFSNAWAIPYTKGSRGRKPMVNAYYNNTTKTELQHGEVVPPGKIHEGLCRGFVGLGCMVLAKPDKTIRDDMNTIINIDDEPYGHLNCISGFDEQMLSQVLILKTPIYHIHQQFNWVVGKDDWLLNKEKPKTYQWYNDKPWNQTKKDWDDLTAWYALWELVKQKYPKLVQYGP